MRQKKKLDRQAAKKLWDPSGPVYRRKAQLNPTSIVGEEERGPRVTSRVKKV